MKVVDYTTITQGNPVIRHAGWGQGALNCSNISKPELWLPMHLRGMGEGMCRINNVTSSSAANTFKIEGALRAPLYPNHESVWSSSGGAWCSWRLENLSPNWICPTKSPFEEAWQSTFFLLSRCTAHPWEGHVEGCSPAQSNDPVPILDQSPLSFFPAGHTHCTEIAKQHQDQSSMVGNQKAWEKNIKSTLKS